MCFYSYLHSCFSPQRDVICNKLRNSAHAALLWWVCANKNVFIYTLINIQYISYLMFGGFFVQQSYIHFLVVVLSVFCSDVYSYTFSVIYMHVLNHQCSRNQKPRGNYKHLKDDTTPPGCSHAPGCTPRHAHKYGLALWLDRDCLSA